MRRVPLGKTAANIPPAWSPDGKSIAYESTKGGSRNLYLVDALTGDETRLTTSVGNDVNASWSPDSTKIVFQSERSGLWQGFFLDVSSGKTTRLTDSKTKDHNPQFLPHCKMV